MGISAVLEALEDYGLRERDGGWSAQCPSHDDSNPSLSICEAQDGRVLLKCHAGCETATVLADLGLRWAVLFPEKRGASAVRAVKSRATAEREIVYEYKYLSGDTAFQVVRRPGKQFRQRRPAENGGWIWNLQGVIRVPYRLPELAAAKPRQNVFIVEGEKDVETLRAKGEIASTNAGGAGKWLPDHSSYFEGRHVVVLPDNDEVGRKHGQTVAKSLDGVAASVKLLLLPGLPPKGDVSDWLAAGGTIKRLRNLVQKCPRWTPDQRNCEAQPDEGGAHVITLSDVKPEKVDWLWPGRIPLGKVTILDGDPGLGKSTMLADLIGHLTTGRPLPGEKKRRKPIAAVLLAHEDGLGDTTRPRLDAAKADTRRVYALAGFPAPGGGDRLPSIPDDIQAIAQVVEKTKAKIVVIDPLFAYLNTQVDSFRDHDVRAALAPLGAMAEKTGAAVVLVRHLRKTGGAPAMYRGGGSIGIMGLARSGLLLAKDPDDENARILASIKSNLTAPPPSLHWGFKGGTPPTVEWFGETKWTADQLVNVAVETAEDRSALEQAQAFLLDFLVLGPKPAREIIEQAEEQGIATPTLRRAAKRLRVRHRRPGKGGGWVWELPNMINTKKRSSCAAPEGGSCGNRRESRAGGRKREGDHRQGDQAKKITFKKRGS